MAVWPAAAAAAAAVLGLLVLDGAGAAPRPQESPGGESSFTLHTEQRHAYWHRDIATGTEEKWQAQMHSGRHRGKVAGTAATL